ncbi:MAG: hypothetical protein K5928_06935 [Prevotella sp.]|nr:hypothetical protein [Prevotella sp.]
MKKHYIAPETIHVEVTAEPLLGIASVGNEYNQEDVTYGRGRGRDLWDDEEQ